MLVAEYNTESHSLTELKQIKKKISLRSGPIWYSSFFFLPLHISSPITRLTRTHSGAVRMCKYWYQLQQETGANAACMLEWLPIETCFRQGALMLNDADLRTLTINGTVSCMCGNGAPATPPVGTTPSCAPPPVQVCCSSLHEMELHFDGSTISFARVQPQYIYIIMTQYLYDVAISNCYFTSGYSVIFSPTVVLSVTLQKRASYN